MKNLIIVISFFFCLVNHAQEKQSLKGKAEAFQVDINKEYADKKTSPLSEKERKKFTSLDFFAIDTTFIVVADFVRTPYEAPFKMQTTTDRESVYVKYGELHFSLKGKECQLNVYQSQRLVTDPKYKDYLFVPFTDLTNGEETYGGGRYLDLSIPKSTKMVIDFNQAYNPYCAYSSKFSCPIPPAANNLPIQIMAGVKKPVNAHH